MNKITKIKQKQIINSKSVAHTVAHSSEDHNCSLVLYRLRNEDIGAVN